MIVFEVLKAFFGAIFILFLPGFAWSFVFFRKEIQWVERMALSFGLSIAIVPLTVFWLNWLLHVRITLLNTSLTISVLILAPVAYLLIRQPSLREQSMLFIRNLASGDVIRRIFRKQVQ